MFTLGAQIGAIMTIGLITGEDICSAGLCTMNAGGFIMEASELLLPWGSTAIVATIAGGTIICKLLFPRKGNMGVVKKI